MPTLSGSTRHATPGGHPDRATAVPAAVVGPPATRHQPLWSGPGRRRGREDTARGPMTGWPPRPPRYPRSHGQRPRSSARTSCNARISTPYNAMADSRCASGWGSSTISTSGPPRSGICSPGAGAHACSTCAATPLSSVVARSSARPVTTNSGLSSGVSPTVYAHGGCTPSPSTPWSAQPYAVISPRRWSRQSRRVLPGWSHIQHMIPPQSQVLAHPAPGHRQKPHAATPDPSCRRSSAGNAYSPQVTHVVFRDAGRLIGSYARRLGIISPGAGHGDRAGSDTIRGVHPIGWVGT